MTNFVAERHAAEAEFLTAVRVDGKRRFEFAKDLTAGTENNFQLILAGGDAKLVFISKGQLLEFFHIFLTIEIKIHGIAEARANRSIWLVGDTQNVQGCMLFPFYLFELQRRGRNLHGKMNLRGIGRSVEEWRLHQSSDVALHFPAGASLQILLDRVAGQKIHGLGAAIATTGADIDSSTIHFHLQRVATPFG